MSLVERHPQAFLDNFRTYAQNLRQRYAELGRDADADPRVVQATELLARLDAAAGE